MANEVRHLAGKCVAITGAGRGLGEAYACLAARQGAHVLVNDVDVEEGARVVDRIRGAGGSAVGHIADISKWEGANSLVEHCVKEFGGIDALINNAAMFWMAEPLADDPEDVRRMVEVNLLGTAYCGMAAGRAMIAQGRGGAILNVVSGAQSGSPQMAIYGATKGAAASLTYSWALELAPYGIRVNAISPLAHTRQAKSIDLGLHQDKPPEGVAPLAIYLVSDLSAAINGQVVFISGDELALVSHPAIALPSCHRSDPTIESLAQLFASEFEHRQMPLGRSRQRIEVMSTSSAFTVS